MYCVNDSDDRFIYKGIFCVKDSEVRFYIYVYKYIYIYTERYPGELTVTPLLIPASVKILTVSS